MACDYLQCPFGVAQVQKQWQKRWFVLKEIFLWYMDSHLGSPILGIIPLEGAVGQSIQAGLYALASCQDLIEHLGGIKIR